MSITMTVLYPNEEGSKFDWDYYMNSHNSQNSHMKLVAERLAGPELLDIRVIKGLAGGAPGESPAYQEAALIHYESMDGLVSKLTEHGPEVMGDIPNYTSVQPLVQFSEDMS